jgi:hypothetical protein
MLLSARNVAVIGPGVGAILSGDRAVRRTQCTGLTGRNLALAPFTIDAGDLVMLASKHFMLTRMVARPGGFSEGCPTGSDRAKRAQAHQKLCGDVHDRFSFPHTLPSPGLSFLYHID